MHVASKLHYSQSVVNTFIVANSAVRSLCSCAGNYLWSYSRDSLFSSLHSPADCIQKDLDIYQADEKTLWYNYVYIIATMKCRLV